MFDGASQGDGDFCGVVVVLKLLENIVCHIRFRCGRGSNTKGELMDLWCFLFIAHLKCITLL